MDLPSLSHQRDFKENYFKLTTSDVVIGITYYDIVILSSRFSGRDQHLNKLLETKDIIKTTNHAPAKA